MMLSSLISEKHTGGGSWGRTGEEFINETVKEPINHFHLILSSSRHAHSASDELSSKVSRQDFLRCLFKDL